MAADGTISAEQQQLAEREELVLAESPYPIEAPHFVMMVRNQIDKLFSAEEIYQQGGLVVHTTLDLDWQHQAEATIQHQLAELQRSPEDLGHNVNNAALVALDPHNGRDPGAGGQPGLFQCREQRRDRHGACATPARFGAQAAGLRGRAGSIQPDRRLDGCDHAAGRAQLIPDRGRQGLYTCQLRPARTRTGAGA